MDHVDLRIIDKLQRDCTVPISAIAEAVSVSSSACHRRIKAMEEAGIITGYVARVDPRQLGLNLHAFVEITLTSQSRESMDRFENAVGSFDDILECRLMSGNADYLLRVSAHDLDHFDQIHRDCLSRLPGVSSMRSSFVIRTIKRWSGFPVE